MCRLGLLAPVVAAVVGVAAGLWGVSSAVAASAEDGTDRARIVVRQATVRVSEADPNRCVAVAFARVPAVANATGYEVRVHGESPSRDTERKGPPFSDDVYRVPVGGGKMATFEVDAGSHWFAVASASSGVSGGCDAFEAFATAHLSITSATATIATTPSKPRSPTKPKPPLTTKTCNVPVGRAVDLKGPLGDDRFLVIRKNSGPVSTIRSGDGRPIDVFHSRFVRPGDVVSTGKNGLMKIGSMSGSAVLIGPETTVRMTNRGFVILDQRPDAPFKLYEGPFYRTRTNGCVLAVRG